MSMKGQAKQQLLGLIHTYAGRGQLFPFLQLGKSSLQLGKTSIWYKRRSRQCTLACISTNGCVNAPVCINTRSPCEGVTKHAQ